MKKWLLFILCLVCITSNCSYASTQQELLKNKQIILNNFVKDNKPLTYTELKNALKNTENELYSIHRMKNADHSCYPNGVIKQTKIIESDGRITYEYFNIYGISVGTLTYKNNKLISTSRPEPIEKPNIVSTNNGSSNKDLNNLENNKLRSIGGLPAYYTGDKITCIGNMPVYYTGNKITCIGNMPVYYTGDKITCIGNMPVYYTGDKITCIGNMPVYYTGE
ncbi:MAG TPA: hypothetical protein DEF63_05970 [Cyanobacteria bacterium UBA11440]|nr:hypothetical protein [Cyanobacteria bacterium UBA11440]